VADPCSDNDAIQVYEGDDPDACRRAIMALHGRVVGACDEGACFGSIVEFGEGCIYVLYDDEEWRDYEERESGAVRYILNHNADVIWATPCGASVLTLIDLMEVKK
jgi:hypothetical protein